MADQSIPPDNQHNQTNNSQSRRQSSYSSPHSYPSPSMQAAYTYPPPQGQSNAEPYRSSPTGSSVPLPPLNLPPIRSIDGQASAQAQAPPAGPQSIGSPLPPPVAPMSAFYPHPAHSLPPPGQAMQIASSPHHPRYPLPAQGPDQRIMSGGRHKKEIKRRTKTGCLTCRKRRIKCDEAHPTCRNCQKSKRECLGYDPIFKQQPSPALLQPAPSASAPTVSTPESATTTPTAYSSVPPGYPPSATPSYAPNIGANSNPPSSGEQSYEYTSAIDPALAGSDGAMSQALRAEGRGDAEGPVLYGGASASHARKVKKLKADDLFAVSGIPPPDVRADSGEPSAADKEDMKTIFVSDYIPGLNHFLETDWYTTEALPLLFNTDDLCRFFCYVINQFKAVKSDDYDGNRRLQSLEAKLVWRLLCLCRSAEAPTPNGANGATAGFEGAHRLDEVKRRLSVFEKLVTWQAADSNPLADLSYPDTLAKDKSLEVKFWLFLGVFVSLRGGDAESAKELDTALAGLRHMLDLRENRDVLYSMVIAQHVGAVTPGFPHAFEQAALSTDPNDPFNKLVIAKRFLENQAGGKGTNQVIQRLSGMSVVSWSA